MSEPDLFDLLRISALTEAEKLDLVLTNQYLNILVNDQSMSVRIRARRRLNKDCDERMKEQLQYERSKSDIKQLIEESNSPDFSTRVRAKSKLQKLKAGHEV